MDSQRLKQIEEVFLAVFEMPAAERESFFKEHCAADEELRREVESLLAFEENSVSFLDKPPEALAAEMFAEEEKKMSLAGRQIGHYKVKKLLGKGGMGEVYLAEDVRLNRQVALKFLSLNVWGNQNALRRFKQEAFAASALNHPNILTIYEFEAKSDICYLAAEYIEGETLREKMRRERLTIQNALSIAEQIARALAAAHKAKIIHRDIKPENIMLREDELVKVLDFGLAKLAHSPDESLDDFETRKISLTRSGAIIGTAFYMSPEQIRGKTDIDARTDIWSLGIVLFEMLTGEVPFAGENTGDIIASVLKTEAPPLSKYIDDCPPELEEIVRKALAGNVEDRYQQMQELAAEIKSLKNRLEFEAALEHSNPANAEKVTRRAQILAISDNETQKFPMRITDNGEAAAISYPKDTEKSLQVSEGKKAPIALIAAVVLITLAVTIGGFFVWNAIRPTTIAQQNLTQVSPSPSDISPVKPSLQLEYSLTVQSYNDGIYKNPFKLSGEMLFGNKDRVRLNIESPQDGFLYILNESPKDKFDKSTFNILFPSPTTNGGNSRLSAEQVIQIPENSWFELDGKEGTELVWLVWSPNQLAELESAKRFANPTDRGKIKDAALTEFIQSLLQKYQANRKNVSRDDDKRMSQITSNDEILAHVIKLEHH